MRSRSLSATLTRFNVAHIFPSVSPSPASVVTAIAVLPFVNRSADADNEYFSDGITEEIINALTKVSGLRVIARTSSFAYKGKEVDVRKIGQELDVNSILEGSVRKAGNRVRITAQLVDAENGIHFWSQNFDRELTDIFALQDEISLLIANQVRDNFGHYSIADQLVAHQTPDISAYEAYLRGRFYQLRWTPEDLRTAIEFYDQSSRLDENFARSYYGLMQSYGLLAAWGYMPAEEGFEKGFHAFLKGKEIDAESPEYYMAFVGRFFWKEWEYDLAYKHIVATLSVNPGHMDALEAMAELMLLHGEFEMGATYVARALAIDPLSGNHHYTLANNYYMREEYGTALQHLDRALSLNPDLELAALLRLFCFLLLGDETAFRKALPSDETGVLLDALYAAKYEPDFHLDAVRLNEWRQSSRHTDQLAPLELFILANGGYESEALELLGEYVDQRRAQVINYRVEPLLQPLRSLPGFAELHHSTLSLPVVDPFAESSAAEENTGARFDPQTLEKDEERLRLLLDNERPYLDAQLSLGDLADRLDVHPNYLSYLINDRLEMNFNEMVNGLRLEAFKRAALDPANAHLTLLAIAFDSGFNSKTVFNTFFKKKEGRSPRAWLKERR